MAVGVVQFPGTNCDRDVFRACELSGQKPVWLWHQDQFDISCVEQIILPGGFSYGDYLRCGALSAKSPVMKSVIEAAKKGVPILGICNGFQVLCEAGLLPGALVRNKSLKFIDKWVSLSPGGRSEVWDKKKKDKIKLPIAHGEGRFVVSDEGLKSLEDNDQVWWTYDDNPNGSISDIAGVINKEKNVAGLMPHPERAMFDWMGGIDGCNFFTQGEV